MQTTIKIKIIQHESFWDLEVVNLDDFLDRNWIIRILNAYLTKYEDEDNKWSITYYGYTYIFYALKTLGKEYYLEVNFCED